MDIYAQIKNSLKEIAGQSKQVIHVAKVVEVEESEATCVCEIDGLQVSDVKLRSVLNEENEQLLIVPKRGSYVLVYDMSMGLMRDFVVVSYSCFASFSLVAALIVYLDKVEKSLYQIFNEEKKRCYKETISYLCALIFLFSTLWKV